MRETTIARMRSAKTESRRNIEKIVELKNLVKVFGQQTAVDDVNLNIRKGEFVTLLGPSGCGKTTILRMIAGFETPSSGTVFLEGRDVTNVPPHKRELNTVFQRYALFPHLNVFKNIAFGLQFKLVDTTDDERMKKPKVLKRKLTPDEIKKKVEAALKLVGLDDYGPRDVDSLSGGQQQRIAVARALVNEPKVLLLDEPLGALDLKMRKEMQTELRRMHKELGITFIYVTHDQEEALTMSDTVVVINDGTIQQVGTPREIYDEPSNAFVADFIGESNILTGIMLADFKVKFLGEVFDCVDKGFDKNEPVDILLRPEDIQIVDAKGGKAQLVGVVTSSIFKGDYCELIVKSNEYELTVQTMQDAEIGAQVGLYIAPDSLHIMEKEAIINEFKTVMTGPTTVEIAGEDFEVQILEGQTYEKGDLVTAYVQFKDVELTDSEKDGLVGANVAQSIYKGTYYHVKVWTDNDTAFIVNTSLEWDNNDRVGVKIAPGALRLELRTANGGENE